MTYLVEQGSQVRLREELGHPADEQAVEVLRVFALVARPRKVELGGRLEPLQAGFLL